MTAWKLRGKGYEFCNCDFGCGCNFGGFPNSKDGSCQAVVGMVIAEGACGDVDLGGVTCAAIVQWPKAIHEGNGKAVFVVEPSASDAQVDALAKICTGQLGGMPWEILGTTFEVVGLERKEISISGTGMDQAMKADGLFEARGSTFKNPVTGEDHHAIVDLPDGFIWTRGSCGQGSFKAGAAGITLDFDKTNWIFYDFDWSNAGSPAAAA